MLCVECAHPVPSLYTYYSADNILATTCKNCGKFADKYIEGDNVGVFLDLVLLRPQAVRHVVFNTLEPPSHKPIHPQTVRLLIFLTLFDVYLQWESTAKAGGPDVNKFITKVPLLRQYMSFLLICICDHASMQIIIHIMARYWLHYEDVRALFTAVVLFSSAKLLPILTLIWDYDMPAVATMVWCALGVCLVEGLAILLGCNYGRALVIAAAALCGRWLLCSQILWPLILTSP